MRADTEGRLPGPLAFLPGLLVFLPGLLVFLPGLLAFLPGLLAFLLVFLPPGGETSIFKRAYN